MWIEDILAITPEVREQSTTSALCETLLVTCPADRGFGGLLLLQPGSWLRRSSITVVDRLGSMGLHLSREYLLRVIQPGHLNGCIIQYHKTGTVWTMSNSELAEVHDVIIFQDAIWAASTGTNEIVKLNFDGSLNEKIKLPGEPDSWHVNCFDVWRGRLVASCFGNGTTRRGWKDKEHENGFIFDVETLDIVWPGLTMPHTPRLLEDGTQLVCNSGTSSLHARSPDGIKTAVDFAGYFTRGMAVSEKFIYVGLSERRSPEIPPHSGPRAHIGVVDRTTLKPVTKIELPFREVYDIVVI